MIVFTEERQFDASGGTTDRHFTQDPAGSGLSPASFTKLHDFFLYRVLICWIRGFLLLPYVFLLWSSINHHLTKQEQTLRGPCSYTWSAIESWACNIDTSNYDRDSAQGKFIFCHSLHIRLRQNISRLRTGWRNIRYSVHTDCKASRFHTTEWRGQGMKMTGLNLLMRLRINHTVPPLLLTSSSWYVLR